MTPSAPTRSTTRKTTIPFFIKSEIFQFYKDEKLVKSPKTVMPDLIRHPEVIEFTGIRLLPE
jgi:hypothetical protein